MITGPQVKAALSFLGWSRKKLSEVSNVPERTIQRIAEAEGVPNANAQTVAEIQRSLEDVGISFLDDGDDSVGNGVSYRKPD